jgi:hypothetical protein
VGAIRVQQVSLSPPAPASWSSRRRLRLALSLVLLVAVISESAGAVRPVVQVCPGAADPFMALPAAVNLDVGRDRLSAASSRFT